MSEQFESKIADNVLCKQTLIPIGHSLVYPIKSAFLLKGVRNIREEGIGLPLMKVRNYFRTSDAFVIVYSLVLVKRYVYGIEINCGDTSDGTTTRFHSDINFK